MTDKEVNSKAVKLFNRWKTITRPRFQTNTYFIEIENLKKECKDLHDVVGVYEGLTDKNALKMASMCSSIRFVQPYQMLMKLQHTTKSY